MQLSKLESSESVVNVSRARTGSKKPRQSLSRASRYSTHHAPRPKRASTMNKAGGHYIGAKAFTTSPAAASATATTRPPATFLIQFFDRYHASSHRTSSASKTGSRTSTRVQSMRACANPSAVRKVVTVFNNTRDDATFTGTDDMIVLCALILATLLVLRIENSAHSITHGILHSSYSASSSRATTLSGSQLRIEVSVHATCRAIMMHLAPTDY